MSLGLLFRDELRGFYRSKVIISLWIGFPILVALMFILNPDTNGVPFSLMTAIMVSTLGGTIASVMLAVSIIGERNNQVYDLFVIRPIKKRDLVLSKFLAVFLCLVMGAILAMGTGMFIDHMVNGIPADVFLMDTLYSFVIALSILSLSCAMGILIGVASPSVLVGAILVIYGGNQVSALPMIPVMYNIPFPPILPRVLDLVGVPSSELFQWFYNISDRVRFSVVIGLLLTVMLIGISIAIFERKER